MWHFHGTSLRILYVCLFLGLVLSPSSATVTAVAGRGEKQVGQLDFSGTSVSVKLTVILLKILFHDDSLICERLEGRS